MDAKTKASAAVGAAPLQAGSTESSDTKVVRSVFDTAEFRRLLKTKWLAACFMAVGETGSTMDDVSALIGRGVSPGAMVLAEMQTKGRGREQRKWSSLPKGNLYFTFFMHVHKNDLPKIGLAVPLAVVAGCHAMGLKTARIKWPNDIWVGRRKLCGMLFDTTNDVDENNMNHANIGVGINVNEDMSSNPEVAKEATSMCMALGKPVSREHVLAACCNALEELWAKSFVQLLLQYRDVALFGVGADVIVMPKKKEDTASYYSARVVGINDAGNLLVRKSPTDHPFALSSEEVTVRPDVDAAADTVTAAAPAAATAAATAPPQLKAVSTSPSS